MHHAGPRAGASTYLPEGSASPHAGMLAERTPAEACHQGHLQPPRNPRKEPARLSGHPGVTACGDELGKTHFCWQALEDDKHFGGIKRNCFLNPNVPYERFKCLLMCVQSTIACSFSTKLKDCIHVFKFKWVNETWIFMFSFDSPLKTH